MSIINKMHQDLNAAQAQPVLSSAQAKQANFKKKLLILGCLALVLCTVYLVFMIVSEKQSKQVNPVTVKIVEVDETITINSEAVPLQAEKPLVEQEASSTLDNKLEMQQTKLDEQPFPNLTVETPVQAAEPVEVLNESPATEPNTTEAKKVSKQQAQPKTVAVKEQQVKAKSQPKQLATTKPVNNSANKPAKKTKATNEQLQPGHLNIETAQLTKQQLAAIYLKEADKARLKGDNELAAEKWQKALNADPKLNDVRKSLATYYYGQNEVKRSVSLLKQGALVSPEYSDFNLMLARISLKEGDQQKAYLYLEQNPPQVEGHLDYYVTHAILAQKFKLYERAEQLYSSMLTQRPNNGRWLMSLAIAQDKQGKTDLATQAYTKALKQTDLSQKAKDYINKRLVFLNKES